MSQRGLTGVAADAFRKRYAAVVAASEAHEPVAEVAAPKHVAILGLGPSLDVYTGIVKRAGSRKAFCDETWGINAVADVITCDRVFHMDDVRIQQVRADANPESNIARMLEWLKVHPGPVYTSRAHDDYPGLVEFPLEDVINDLGHAYFNNTAAYAVAFAIHIGVEKISCFGMDYTYPDAHHAEKGRACVEFLLGIAHARGIRVVVPGTSSLMDAMVSQQERCYGYDTRKIEIVKRDGDGFAVTLTPIDALPTAEEIEERYDHSAHPNRLVA